MVASAMGKRSEAAPPHPRTIGWLGTTALAMGGSNQSLFLIGALILAQGSAAVPLLVFGLLLSWAAAPGWTELVLMWPNRVGGIAATCAEAFRPYSPVLHFQGRYETAHQVQEKAYIAALEGADAWNMAQSRGWQAYGLKAREAHLEAMHTADAALRLVSSQQDTESIRLRARLLAFSAENAALLGQSGEAQRRLDASEELLECLPGMHEEFDRTSWLQQAGACALSLKQYDLATTRLQQALDELPAHWTLRSISTAIPLASAFARQKDRNRALTVAGQTVPVVQASQSPSLKRDFMGFLQDDLLVCFPTDRRCQDFVAEAQQQLALA